MADDDASGPQHAEDVSGIDPPKRDLWVVRVDTAQDQSIAQLCHSLAHPRAEEARARTEVVLRWLNAHGRVGTADFALHSMNLLGEVRVAQGSRRLVVHGVVCELVAVVADNVVQGLLTSGDLRSDNEERRGRAVGLEDLQYLIGILGGRIVDGERH